MVERKRLWIIVFILAAVAGAVLVFLLLRDKQPLEAEEVQAAVGDPEDVRISKEDDLDDIIGSRDLAETVPAGRRAVNLPVSFFGDSSVLHEGGRVDIISTYYDRQTGVLDSEKIICAEKIIRLESAGGGNPESGITLLEGAVLPEDVTGRSDAGGYRHLLVLTFFLTDEEVLASFTALERGMLYVALCPSFHAGIDREH